MRRCIAVLAVGVILGSGEQAFGQQFTASTDPRPVLRNLITAFQLCGPPQAYQVLSPQLFQLIAMQTGNSGCYQHIAAAGPVTSMAKKDVQQMPAGPVFAVRVTHQSGAVVDWFIGLSNWTGRVEYLNYVNASAAAPAPTIDAGPVDDQGDSGGEIVQPPPPDDGPDCKIWGTMCQ